MSYVLADIEQMLGNLRFVFLHHVLPLNFEVDEIPERRPLLAAWSRTDQQGLGLATITCWTS
jgi:hypothetical protein